MGRKDHNQYDLKLIRYFVNYKIVCHQESVRLFLTSAKIKCPITLNKGNNTRYKSTQELYSHCFILRITLIPNKNPSNDQAQESPWGLPFFFRCSSKKYWTQPDKGASFMATWHSQGPIYGILIFYLAFGMSMQIVGLVFWDWQHFAIWENMAVFIQLLCYIFKIAIPLIFLEAEMCD